MAAKVKFEKFCCHDSDDEDVDEAVLDDIFKLRTAFTRNSTTSGAMREPLRTLTGQANMNKYLDPDTGSPTPAVSFLECKLVGGKYICPYCRNVVPHTQGIKKGYTRHLGQVNCKKVREAAGKAAPSSSASGGLSGGGVDEEDLDDDDSSVEAEPEDDPFLLWGIDSSDLDRAHRLEDGRPSKRSRI